MGLSSMFPYENIAVFGPGFVFAFFLYIFGVAVYNRFFHPLRHFPGPFWASITPLWYARAMYFGRAHDFQLPIHQKYGPFVRLAPNLISVSESHAIEEIYGPRTGKVFAKGSFYDGFNARISVRRDVFSERNEAEHADRRRIVAPLYTQGAVLSYEPKVDRLVEIFYRRMEQFVASAETLDMSVWLKRYTFDVIGEMFYGRAGGFGMLRDNIDYNNWCLLMETIPIFGSTITYIPYGLQTLFVAAQMVSKSTRIGMKGFYSVIIQANSALQDRLDTMKYGRPYDQGDVLSKLIGIVEDKGDKLNFTMKDVAVELWTVIWGGSDSTAIALTSIFYHLHKYPETKQKLIHEIENAFTNGTLSYPIQYKDACKLPYLRAVISEGLRIHPPFGGGLPRVVPAGGADICGTFVPGNGKNIEVMINAYVSHFDKEIYGNDAESWNPDRWLRCSLAEAANMERHNLAFGYGTRVCIGKHITMTEMYKLLPTILRDFDFELVVDEWQVLVGWFQNQKNVNVKVRSRRPADRPRPTFVSGAMMEGVEQTT